LRLGKGVILLLHGVPGVGKTSTAGKWLLLETIVYQANRLIIKNALRSRQRDLFFPSLVVGRSNAASKMGRALIDTSGDLGLSPKDVETNLQSAFRLAEAWDCVLLLDEADIFLDQRTTGDIERNSLVSGVCLFHENYLRYSKLIE
jgi:hypothetical protein